VAVAACVALAASTAAAQVTSLQVEAAAGEPYGVGKVTLRFRPGSVQDDALQFWMDEPTGRVLYPAHFQPPVRALVKSILQLAPQQATGYFLFRGQEPFELRVYVPEGFKTMVRPLTGVHARGPHQRLLGEWWRAYNESNPLARLVSDKSEDYPPHVENYLSALLARRLRLADEVRIPGLFEQMLGQPKLDGVLAPLVGAEALKLQVQRELVLGRYENEGPAELPLPELPQPPPLAVPPAPPEVRVEPIAQHVPAECFYLRCGSFDNFRWLRQRLEQAGGDLRNLLAARGVNYGVQRRIERQLALQESALSDLLAPVLISDVALIGTDAFLREGAALGVLLQARNAALVSAGLLQQRRQTAGGFEAWKEETLDIAGTQVSYIYTPDGQVRSFQVTDGDYILVTTSRYLAERFLEAGRGRQALAAAPDFIHARALLPVDRNDTVFFFASAAFFENLASPHYRIEMQRRLRALGEIELWRLARLAARGEGHPADTVEQLVQGGFLPRGFGTLPDGSRTVLLNESGDDAAAANSRRGRRGSFVPIPDVPVERVSRLEAQQYAQFVQEYRSRLGRIDPLAVALRRQVAGLPDGSPGERLEIEVRMSPFTQQQWWMNLLGPPDSKRLRPLPGDLISIEAMVGNSHLFAGLRDLNPLPAPWEGGLLRARTVGGYLAEYLLSTPAEYLVGYLGGTRGGGPLDRWFGPPLGPPDPQGLSRAPGGVWRLQRDPYVLLSFHRNVLLSIVPLILFEDAPRPAQVRLHVGDLRQSNTAAFLNTLGYLRAQRTSEGNRRFMQSLARQMRVAPEQCRQHAEYILDGQLQCTLGGEYRLSRDRWRQGEWVSVPPPGDSLAPGRYQFPPLGWFRGLDLDFALLGDTLAAHAELIVQLPDKP
jgi:hypothetical protein